MLTFPVAVVARSVVVLAAWGLATAEAARAAGPMQPGLLAAVSDGRHQVRFAVPTPGFQLAPDESLHPTLSPSFAAEWNGFISVVQAGEYVLEASGAEITIDGRRTDGRAVSLKAGLAPFRLRYRRRPGEVAMLQVRWRSSQFALEPIPSSVFFHEAPLTDDERAIEEGRRLVTERGCVGCHASRSSALTPRRGPVLTGIGGRANMRWLAKWLADPSAFRSGAPMPNLLESPQERADVATYLASLSAGTAAGSSGAPESGAVDRGWDLYNSIGCANCHGQERLALGRLGSKYRAAALAQYLEDPQRVNPSGRMPAMGLSSSEAAALAAALTTARNPAFEKPVPPGSAERGKQLVMARGCLGCHVLEDPAPLVNGLVVADLAAVDVSRGCLADVPRSAPNFRFGGAERAAVRAFLLAQKQAPDVSPAPTITLRKRVRELGCPSCHVLDDLRPPTAPGEAVPHLTAVGAKLRTDWIEQVVGRGKRVRETLQTRMPQFGPATGRELAVLLSKAAGVEPGDGPAPPASLLASAERRTRGHGLIGTNAAQGGMSCVACHSWRDYQALGEAGPQLADVGNRVRYDWFRRWMQDPARIVSGTSMPSFFSGIEAPKADEMIDSLWAAFVAANRLPVPEGYLVRRAKPGSEERPLVERESVVIRWDMPEATPAAIAVGLPGQLSYCFDAGESRLRYAWKGGFIDMTTTLANKALNKITATADLIGTVFYRSAAFPVRVKKLDRIPQRRFRGYRMIDGYPQFHYQVDGVDVFERIVPSAAPVGLRREFVIPRVDQPMWLLDARRPGDRLKIPTGAPARFEVVVPAGEGGP